MTELSDFSVCTTWGRKGNKLFLLHVLRERLEYPDLKRAVRAQADYYRPSNILIEDKLAAYLHELTSFPKGKHDDQADSTSQALDWARQYPSRLPLEEFNRRQLLRWKVNLPDEYIFKQCEEDEEIIAEHFITGERIRWSGEFWQEYA